jgi:hypothetical protein
MAFVPSKYSLADLTVSATADRLGLSNQPANESHLNNLNLLAEFLTQLPFQVRINSAYRAPAVNTAVGGAKSSQHMQGLALDLTPIGLTNKELATWLWVNRASYPELDQVIWYTDTSHVHIGICPPGAVGCVEREPRGAFYTARKEGSDYTRWIPDQAGMAEVMQLYASTRPVRTVGFAALALGGSLSVAVLTLFVALRLRRNRRATRKG